MNRRGFFKWLAGLAGAAWLFGRTAPAVAAGSDQAIILKFFPPSYDMDDDGRTRVTVRGYLAVGSEHGSADGYRGMIRPPEKWVPFGHWLESGEWKLSPDKQREDFRMTYVPQREAQWGYAEIKAGRGIDAEVKANG
jgi:hypothetical protein